MQYGPIIHAPALVIDFYSDAMLADHTWSHVDSVVADNFMKQIWPSR